MKRSSAAARVVGLWVVVLLVLWLLAAGGADEGSPLLWLLLGLPALAVTWLWLRPDEEPEPGSEPGTGPTPTLRRFPLAPDTKVPPTLFLGDVFSGVDDRDQVVWDGAPVPGARVHMLLAVTDGELDARAASARIAPFADGPYALGAPMEARVGAFADELGTWQRFVELTVPEDLEPGFCWLHVSVNEIEFDPIRVEVADPAGVEGRREAFAAADRLLQAAGEATPLLMTGTWNPLPLVDVRRALAADDPPSVASDRCWAFFATRMDADGVIQLQEGRAHNLLVLVDPATGEGSVHRRFGFAYWTLYNYPQRPPRDGYNGWWWKRPDLPAGGTCGTAWCNYPFPGNGVATYSDTVAMAVPGPDPLDWWRGRGGWVCGNGWWYGRRGPGGIRFGPWWPVDGGGVPRPGLGGPGAGPDEPPPIDGEPPEEPSEEPPTSRPRHPPGLDPPPPPASCAAEFVEAVGKYTYGRPPHGRRLRGSNVNLPPARYDMLPRYDATLRWARIPDGWTPTDGYSYAWTDDQAEQELRRNRTWWARYCITVADREVEVADDPALRRLALDYRSWLDSLPTPARPDVVMGFGSRKAQEGVDLLKRVYGAYARALDGDPEADQAVHVLFMPRVVGKTGHTGENRARATEASFTQPGANVCVLHVRDADDPYILTHELIHAFGRPAGRITWDHQSGDPRAMSRVVRQTIAEDADLSESRLLDYAEYDEILGAGLVVPGDG